MTKTERLTASFVSLLTLSVAIFITAVQWHSGHPALRVSPVEIGEGFYLVSIALTLTAISALTWRRDARPKPVWLATAVLCWAWVATDLANMDKFLYQHFALEDAEPVIAWAVAAMAAAAIVLERSLPTSARLLLAAGLGVQGAAFATDLMTSSVFHASNAEDYLSDLYLAAYLSGFILIAAMLPVDRRGREVPLLGRLSDFAPAKYLSILWRSAGWQIWRVRHPDKSYADFYVATVSSQLDRGFAHRTLGRYHFSFDVFASQDKDRATAFGKEGRATFEDILRLGVSPMSTVADFGCGSLRVGQHFIGMLAPGHYWGLDVTDRFYKDGLALLPPELLRTKAPNLAVISPVSLEACRAAKPDIVFSIHVLMHVPQDEMDSYWRNLASLLHDGSRAYVTCNIADKPARTAAVNWAYPEAMLRAAVARAAPGRKVDVVLSAREKRLGNTRFRPAVILIGPRVKVAAEL